MPAKTKPPVLGKPVEDGNAVMSKLVDAVAVA